MSSSPRIIQIVQERAKDTCNSPPTSATKATMLDESAMDRRTELADISLPFFHYLSRTFAARELVRLKCVSKAWKQAVSENSMVAMVSRRENDIEDWYFPLRFELDCFETAADRRSCLRWDAWIWSGIHHTSGEIHRLPSLPSFYPINTSGVIENRPQMMESSASTLSVPCFATKLDCLVASAGGLLLFTEKMLSSTMNPYGWRPLLVFNPLTQRWRILPAANCVDVGLSEWVYDNVHEHMVVDKRAQSYQVILICKLFVCLFKSTSQSWQCRAFSEAIPFGPQVRPRGAIAIPRRGANIHSYELAGRLAQEEFSDVPSYLVGGKVYYAELELDGTSMPMFFPQRSDIHTRGLVRIFEVDHEAGTWKPAVRYALRDCIPHEFADGVEECSFRMKMVECKGGMYVIFPVELDLDMAVDTDFLRANDVSFRVLPQTYGAYGYMPVQFYVLQLHGAGLAFGRVLTRAPSTLDRVAVSRRQDQAFDALRYCLSPLRRCRRPSEISLGGKNWYSCSARGEVIWMLWLDYLVEYDVVTGKSTTRILPDKTFGPKYLDLQTLDYRPSFVMEP